VFLGSRLRGNDARSINSNAAVQALNAGQTLTDTFTATTVGATSQVVTITITGANDAATITGSTTGDVIEAGGVANGSPGNPTATGDLNSTDVDNTSDSWATVTTVLRANNHFGSYTLTAAGVWTYTVDNGNAAVQALNAGQTLTDTFTATTVDGTSQVVTITIQGANDAAVITGTTTGTVAEAGGVANGTPGTPNATGDLNATDFDNVADSWAAITTPAASAGGFGTYVLSSSGGWVYTLNNTNSAVQALNAGGTLTDTFTATTIGGTSQVVTVTINGANDAPHAVPDDDNGDVVKRAVGGAPGDLLAVGNVLDNDVDVDAGDTKTVIAVNGSAANVGQTLVGVYGTLVLTAGGAWTYSLNESDPDTQALALGQTAVDAFSYTMSDSQGATSSTTLDVTVTGGNDPPYIITSSPHRFVTPSEPGDLVFINGFSFQDIDSFGIVTVTIASSNFSDALHATSGGGVAVSGNGSRSITLTGTIADINAFISGNNVAWDPPAGDFDRNFTFTIDDNGSLAGGMVVSTSVFFDERTLSFSDFNSDNVNLAGWNLNNNVFVSTRGGNDTVVTAWSHGPNSNSSDYDGGDGFDTITLVFTPDQLESILSNSTDRGTLQDYLDGDVSAPFDDDSLSLGGTSWNATVTDFEDASLALAAGPSGFVRYDAIGENIPDFEFAPSIGNETLVGTSGNDTISALGDNDIVVGRGGNDTLNGDAGSDMLLGGSGNDTLRGGTGSDILSGGTGADRFVFAETGAINSDSIVDYSFVDGDTLDLSALLDAAYSAGQPISDFVRAVQSGSDIIIQVDIDGGFNSFTDVVTLTRYGTNSADIVRLTFEGTDHLLLV
jgi:VCBS repeat-containing protein